MKKSFCKYKALISTFLFVVFFQILSIAQNGVQNLGGATTQGLAGVGVAFDDITAIYTNQAGLAFLEGWAIDASIDRRFNLEELTTISVAAATKMNIGTIGFTISQYGFDEFSEQKIGFNYARMLTSSLSIGGQFDVLGYDIEGYGNTFKYTVEFGIYSKLTNQVHLGAHIFNPTSIKITSDEELDTRVKIGMKYIPSTKLNLYAEAEKIIDRDTQIKVAASYEVLDDLDINGGVNLNIESFHFGFKYRIQNQFVIAAAFSFNNNLLGNSPGVSTQYWSLQE